jgi:hypothetical protein
MFFIHTARENLNIGAGFFSIMPAGLILGTYVLSSKPLQLPRQFLLGKSICINHACQGRV